MRRLFGSLAVVLAGCGGTTSRPEAPLEVVSTFPVSNEAGVETSDSGVETSVEPVKEAGPAPCHETQHDAEFFSVTPSAVSRLGGSFVTVSGKGLCGVLHVEVMLMYSEFTVLDDETLVFKAPAMDDVQYTYPMTLELRLIRKGRAPVLGAIVYE